MIAVGSSVTRLRDIFPNSQVLGPGPFGDRNAKPRDPKMRTRHRAETVRPGPVKGRARQRAKSPEFP